MVKFGNIKDRLKEVIAKHLETGLFPGEDKGVTLVEGFFNFQILSKFSTKVFFGGPTIPMIAVVSNQSGRIYYYALKKLLPDLRL